jgi:ketosteroid isomerase-like protein
MADRDEIIDLTIAYTWALDTKQLDELRDVFTADATAMLRGRACEGIDAIIERIGGAVMRLDRTQHFVGNHQVHVDGETATCRCQLQGQHVLEGTEGGDNYIVGGYYEDHLVRTSEGWRIEHRVMEQTWADGNAEVIRR